ncbi:MAG: acyltransferase [Prevotella sp.]|nr:acyltransferase [Prevotella sp.]
MVNNVLSRAECNALRGLAIIGIFLHNYCHWLRPMVKENEYRYIQHNVDRLNYVLQHPDWDLIVHLFSFFGHYGVPVFLFLSAYGLVKKYEETNVPHFNGDVVSDKHHLFSNSFLRNLAPSFQFLRIHFLKLFKMMIVGFVAFTMVDAITPGSHRYHLLDIVAQLGLFNNILPHPEKIIWPGPYWFFGLMMQLYIVYRLFLHKRHWGFTVVFIVVCEVIQLCCHPEGEALNRWRYNFIGGMLPFGIGLLTARYGQMMSRRMCAIVLLPSIFMVYYFSNGFFYWTLAPLAVVFTCICLIKVLPQWLMRPLEWMGGISAALFVCHPITRKIFIPVSHRGDVYAGLLLYIVSSIALAWLFRELLRRIPDPKLRGNQHAQTIPIERT